MYLYRDRISCPQYSYVKTLIFELVYSLPILGTVSLIGVRENKTSHYSSLKHSTPIRCTRFFLFILIPCNRSNKLLNEKSVNCIRHCVWSQLVLHTYPRNVFYFFLFFFTGNSECIHIVTFSDVVTSAVFLFMYDINNSLIWLQALPITSIRTNDVRSCLLNAYLQKKSILHRQEACQQFLH